MENGFYLLYGSLNNNLFEKGEFVKTWVRANNIKFKNEILYLNNLNPESSFDEDIVFDYLEAGTMDINRVNMIHYPKENLLIQDYMSWIQNSPLNGEFHPISKKFKFLLENETFNNPNCRFYKAPLKVRNEFMEFYIWQNLSIPEMDLLNMKKSELVIENSRNREIVEDCTNRFTSLSKLKEYCSRKYDYFHSPIFKKLTLNSKFQNLDVLSIPGNKIPVISHRLKLEIEEKGITGVEFKNPEVPINFDNE
ncbi:hypothetical protein [Marinigracilibium pacificum]|uniref:Immunity protein 43 of polymorphic toxin system n=1 Tax=Marinigracilibium pacificum TaxID=2729599 RepID=A0A848J4T6_9BACT|nr:hypothetical protein [Marinigracilibium pacificum]NMM50495.1 hypothetical protein [Marinigracilibium pacificum]